MPTARTPQQRDRQFIRVRRLTQGVFVAASALSVLFVGYASAKVKPVATYPVTSPSGGPVVVPPTSPPTTQPTTAPTSPPTTQHSGGGGSTNTTPTTVYVPPKPAPTTTTTVCYSTPSGHVTCY